MAEPINITNSVADIDTAKKTISTPSVTFDIASMKVGENGVLLATSKDGRVFSIDPKVVYPKGNVSAQNLVDEFDKNQQAIQNKQPLARIVEAIDINVEDKRITTPSVSFDIKTVSARGDKLLVNGKHLVDLPQEVIAEQAARLSSAGIQLDTNNDKKVSDQEVIEALAKDLNASKGQASVSPEAAGTKQQNSGKAQLI